MYVYLKLGPYYLIFIIQCTDVSLNNKVGRNIWASDEITDLIYDARTLINFQITL